MAEYNCKDINGNDIGQFVFGNDGVVYGVTNYQNLETNYETNVPYDEDENLTHLSLECCSSIGQAYDSDFGKCYHRVEEDVDVKVVFNIDNHNGLIFTKTEQEECSLNLKFNYLIEYNSDILFPIIENGSVLVSDILKSLDLSVLIEKKVDKVGPDGVIYEGLKTLETIFERKIYSITDFNSETGVLVSGTKKGTIENKLEDELGVTYSAKTLDSNWLTADILISDPSIIESIINEEIKFSVLVNNADVDFSIIMDNIELIKTSEKEYIERKTIDKSPSFNLKRVVDNKKSWTQNDSERLFDLELRETDYEVDSDKMILNSKEIELSTSIFETIAKDVAKYIMDNPGLLSGDATSLIPHEKLNISEMLSKSVSDVKSVSELLELLSSELIDVKSRQGMIDYPVLRLVYERYLKPEGYTGNSSNKFTQNELNRFSDIMGRFWSDLVEQVVPSTSIWSSTQKIGVSMFAINKFKYNRYNLRFNYRNNDDFLLKENNVEVLASEITRKHPTTDRYGDIYIKSFGNQNIAIGNVGIVGSGDNNTNIVNEG